MVWGLTLETFTRPHVVVSLIGIASGVVVFLASDDSSYTGTELFVDGGIAQV